MNWPIPLRLRLFSVTNRTRQTRHAGIVLALQLWLNKKRQGNLPSRVDPGTNRPSFETADNSFQFKTAGSRLWKEW